MSTHLSDAPASQLARPEPGSGVEGRLRAARVLQVGAGALGCPVAAYLVGAGVGLLGLVDPGAVEPSELDGQFLHFSFDVGHNKAERAAAKLGALNPAVQVEPYPALLERHNAAAVVAGHDLVVDCSNSEPTRQLLNDACLALEVPLVLGAARASSGLVTAVRPHESACYRCSFPHVPCETDPVGVGKAQAPIAGLIGSIQALEAIKLLSGTGKPLFGCLLWLDASTLATHLRPVRRRDDCRSCG